MKPIRPGDLIPAEPSAPRISRRSLLLGGAGIATLAAGGLATYSGAEAATALNVTRYKLAPRGWPAGQRLSITVLADLHAGGPNMGIERIRNVVDTANMLRSDIVLLLGDFVATHRFVTEHVPGPFLGRGDGASERAFGRACHSWKSRLVVPSARNPLLADGRAHSGDGEPGGAAR